MALWERSFDCTQNADFSTTLGFAVASPTGQLSLAVPFSFAGSTAIFTVNETSDPSSTQLVRLTNGAGLTFGTSVVGVVNVGTIQIFIPNATTVTFPVGTWYCDLIVVNGSIQTYFAAGPFIVAPSISR